MEEVSPGTRLLSLRKNFKNRSLHSWSWGRKKLREGTQTPRDKEEGGQDSWLPEHSVWLPSSGEFILMYLLMLLLFGIPLLYMEMIMGQWLRIDSTRIWKQLVPCLGGIGYASILVNEGSGQEASQLQVPCSLQVPCLHPARPSGPLYPPLGVHLGKPV